MRHLILVALLAVSACAAERPVRVAQAAPDAPPPAVVPQGVCSYGC